MVAESGKLSRRCGQGWQAYQPAEGAVQSRPSLLLFCAMSTSEATSVGADRCTAGTKWQPAALRSIKRAIAGAVADEHE
eukprot:scaffold7989_cov107-Isochrysis_galbana.AAC.3